MNCSQLNTPLWELAKEEILRLAVALCAEKNVGFVDAHHAALLRKRPLSTLYSYDKDFDGLPELRRLESQIRGEYVDQYEC